MSQERLAELSDLSPPYVSHVERGAKGPSLGALIRLSAALGVTIDYLLAGSQPADPAAFMADAQTLLADCSLIERRIVLQVALATKTALRQAVRISARQADTGHRIIGTGPGNPFSAVAADRVGRGD